MGQAATKQAAYDKGNFVRPDSKGRITLGSRAKGISRYQIIDQPDGSFLLMPMVEIPAREKWLWENKEALKSVKEGIEQSARGETVYRGSFAQSVDEDD